MDFFSVYELSVNWTYSGSQFQQIILWKGRETFTYFNRQTELQLQWNKEHTLIKLTFNPMLQWVQFPLKIISMNRAASSGPVNDGC